MEALKQSLQANINGILPHLDDLKVDNLVDFLISKGVKKEKDLRRLTVETLDKHLDDLVDASDLHEEWQKAYGTPAPLPTAAGATQAEPNRSSQATIRQSVPGGSKTLSSVENLRKQVQQPTKMPVFDSESPYIPASVRTAIDNKKRAPVSGRTTMVERIVDHCRETVPGLTRSMFNIVALQLVTTYPDTFKDTLLVSEDGSESLAKQFRDKFDNDKRPEIPTQTEKQAPAVKEAYGCIDWNPELPTDETDETQENKRLMLVDMHHLSKKEWTWKVIKKNMETSYYLQRKDINQSVEDCAAKSRKRKRRSEVEDEVDNPKVTVSQIKERWPFLFTPRGMNYHFKCLTNVDFRDKLHDFIQEESGVIIDCLSSKNDNQARLKREMLRAEKRGLSSVKLPAVLKMMTLYLKDDIDHLVQFVEPTTSFEDVVNVANFPENEGTPILIAAGNDLFDTRKYFLCVDETPVSVLTSLLDAFGMLFCSYFVLNLEYSSNLSGLLTFIQRAIAKINAKGGKCKTAALTRRSHERSLSFHNKITDYKQMLEDEENL